MEVSRAISALALAGGVAAGLTGAAAAQARSLAQEADINQRLMEMSVADEIRKRCDSISARIFAGLSLMRELEAKAMERGYSKAEIEAYVTDKEEKRKMRARADAYIRSGHRLP